MSTIKTQLTILIAISAMTGMLVAATSAEGKTILLEDDFNDNSIDAAKWNVVTTNIPQNPKSAVETNMQMELEGRAHLNTVQQFNPGAFASNSQGGIEISGTWEFVSSDDFMQILTRSDGAPDPGNCCGETTAGIEFRAFATGSDNVNISGRGGAPINNQVGDGPFPNGITGGDVFDFVIMDDGFNLSLTLTRTSNPADTLTVTADSTFAPATNLITFHNREAGRRSNLDNVLITTGTPEPNTFLLAATALMGLALLRRPRRRRVA